jgi:hypothetical protein
MRENDPVEIYTTPICGYCHAAKRLLTQKGAAFTEIDVSRDPALRAAMTSAPTGGAPCRRSSSGRPMSAAATTFMRWIGRASLIRCWRADAMRAGLVQLTVGDDPAANLPVTWRLCAGGGRGAGSS